ncbi:MAG: hybrid sensor histidine kinase/response regulator [Bacteroidetes bacterium HGW-Bacteroidetes-1]|jgi:PAS domain S-box-containing protein|nr:MAG: hybrid sensor histidine kinase/response regulator [Bacteroidetes bacterium HGW-Bacteroidetes-1]
METKKKQESLFARRLIEASLDPLVTISPKGKITDMNQATIHITGLDREKLTGTNFFDYFTEPQKAKEVYQEVFANGSVINSPLTLRHIEGKLTDVLFNGSVYKDDSGKALGVVIVARDVTDEKRIATELTEAKIFAELATELAIEAKAKAERATRIAKDAVKAKQQFLSNMSHEIRTPMNAIIGFTKVLLKTELSIKQKEYLNAIKLSGNSLIVLINDILDLAKVDAGKMVFEKIPFRLAQSIDAMLHIFELKIQEKNLTLVREYDKNIPKILLGDPVRLHQIILNLLSNAVKFTVKGKITVIVRILHEDEEKASLEFVVSDTGIGIQKENIGEIFENFQQASSITSRLYGGTGLGLAIVKQLVENQHGTVNVESTPGVGSTFSFVLDFQKTKEQPEEELENTDFDKSLKWVKVLVVEDIALNQLLMKTLLDDFGFESEIVSNGKIAVDKLHTHAYDIILMDLQMPEMNGFEATEYIRKELKLSIPIIAITSDVTTADLSKCKAVGMNDYIAKPIDERLLYTKIIGSLKKNKQKGVVKSVPRSKEKFRLPKYINLNYLNQRTKSNPDLMSQMILLYLTQTPPLIKAMKESLLKKDMTALHAAVHKLIPSFIIMGIDNQYETMAKEIQEFTSTKKPTKEIRPLVKQLENVLKHSCKELEIELNNIKINQK